MHLMRSSTTIYSIVRTQVYLPKFVAFLGSIIAKKNKLLDL